MKKIKLFRTLPLLIALILECLPWGVAMYFGNPDGDPFLNYCSYFDFLPYGYGIFGPFLTAALTCVLLLLSAAALFTGGRRLNRTISILASIATFLSISPLLYVANSFTIIGAGISLCMIATLILSLWEGKHQVF